MLDSLRRPPGSLRWPPRQRFIATEVGRHALEGYEQAIARYQAGERHEREELERIQQAWARERGVEAGDALVLGETIAKGRLPREIHVALADCGLSLADVQASLDRLFKAGLVEPKGGGGPLSVPRS
ncbi:MAG: hypothetical protein ACOX6T_18715 [Myxococcales bacterium]|jgi:hypothetical protein